MCVQKMVIINNYCIPVCYSVLPSLAPAIFICIMVPYLQLAGLFMISSHRIICHFLFSILSIPFPVLLMSTFLLSQVLKHFFLAKELLPWLLSQATVKLSCLSIVENHCLEVQPAIVPICSTAHSYLFSSLLVSSMFSLAFGVKITVLSSLFHSKIPNLVCFGLSLDSVTSPNKKCISSGAHL